MQLRSIRVFSLFILILSVSVFIGCAGMEFAPKNGIWYYPQELPEAERAVQEAQASGKDKECPAEFNEAKSLKDKAYEIYWACRTNEAIEMAKNATEKAKELCPAKPKKEAKVIDRMTLTINFEFDKAKIRESDRAKLKKAIDFIKKYPGARIQLEGHTCSIGTEQYNQALSERRAEAAKRYFINAGGIDESLISTVGYGETQPIASNKTREGRAKNRRVEILVLSD